MRKAVALFLVVNILLLGAYSTSYAGEYQDKLYIEYDGQVYRYTSRIVSLVVDGQAIETGDMPAIIIDGRTLVPAREVFESSGINAKVEWNGDKQEVYITYGDQNIVLKIGSTVATVNGEDIDLDVPPKLIRDLSKDYPKTMIPLRFVTENLGFGIEWNQDTYTATMTSPDLISDNQTSDTNTSDETTTGEATETENSTDETNDASEGQLDGLGSAKANRSLPTELFNAPITWGIVDSNAVDIIPGTEPTVPEVVQTDIKTQKNPAVNITSVDYSDDNGQKMFKIQASGPISQVDTSIWEDKYIFDIHRANYALDDDNTYKLTYNDNPIVMSVRSSPQEKDSNGDSVLRVVFDLKNPTAQYQVKISDDRKTLYFEMLDSSLTSVKLGQNNLGDFIELKGTSAPSIEAFRLSNPDRIVFDIPNMVTKIGYQSQDNVGGQYITSIRTAQFDPSTSRVVVETDGQPDYKIINVDNKTTMIQFVEPSYDNINYSNSGQPIITLQNAKDIPIDNIKYDDHYYNKQYIIHLPGDYENLFGQGGLQVDDNYIDSVEIIKNNSGNTDIVINEKDIFVFRIEADEDNVYLKAYKPAELYSKIVVLDFGHGGTDPGAIGNGLKEKDLNLAMGLYAKKYFDADPSFKVYYTRRDDTFIPLQGRTDLANDVGADIFVSIHNNAFISSYTGTETWYFKDDDRPELNSVELARILHKYILPQTGLPDRGVKNNNSLFVLRNTDMPAALIEGGFVTSPIDSKVISNPTVQDNIGKAIYNAIVEVFKEYPTGR